jgi:signal transduction histidine kinase
VKHRSIRVRLTLVYAAILLFTCTALLALNYVLLYQSLYSDVHGQPSAAPVATYDPKTSGEPGVIDKYSQFVADQAERERRRGNAIMHTAGSSAIALAVTAVLGLGLSWIVAGRMLRPLRTLTATTRRISHDRLDERIGLAGPPDELKELADTFDEMVARLEASFNAQRRFVADASHELRTPLSIVHTGAEVLLAKRESTVEQWEALGRRTLTATNRAERLLDGLLALARSDSGVLGTEPHDLALAAATAVAETDQEAESGDLTVSTDLRPAPVHGDPVLLDRLVRNLVDNAIRHNHTGGWVDVRTARDDGHAVVTVANSGADIPVSEVDRLFEPFQRLSHGRTDKRTTGLGLSIVRSIVRAHNGTVTASPTAKGGLTVTVTLPSAPRSRQDQV